MNSPTSQPPSHLPPQEARKPQRKPSLNPTLRFSRLCGVHLLGFIFYLSSFILSSSAPPPELTILRQQYDKVVAERVTAPFDASKAALDTKFAAALENAISTAKGAGELKTVLALEAEKKRLADKLPLPAEDSAAPEALQKLRVIYQEQLTKLEEARTANHAALLPAYTAKLAALEVTLTKADRVAEAAEVLTYREGLAAGTPPPAAVSMPTTVTPASESASEEKKTALKPSEASELNRKLAEWCLNNRHEIDIEADRKRSKIQNLQDLPKDKFELTRINFVASLPPGVSGPFPWNALHASPNLDFIYLDLGDANTPVTMDDLAHLGALKQLKSLQLGGTKVNWVDFNVQRLPTMPSLKSLTFGKASQTLEISVLKEKFPSLGYITFGFVKIPPETFEQFKAWPGLWQLRLDGSSARLTEAHITALSKLPELHSLILYPFSTEVHPSIKSLTRVSHINLNYDCPVETFKAVCSVLSLESLQLSQIKNVKDADFAAITSLSKLTELKAYNMSGLTDACVTHITPLKDLTSLDIGGTPVTDAILPELAKMKKLKKLVVRKSQITEAGIASLKKQRPDIQINP